MEKPREVALTWRPLTAADLPLLPEWLREPLVARWWNHDTNAEVVQRDFRPCVRGEEPGEDLVILVDGERIGLLQRSVIRDYPEDFNEFAAIVDVPDGAVELDYLIGDAARRGRGLGARMIAAAACSAIRSSSLAARPSCHRPPKTFGQTCSREGHSTHQVLVSQRTCLGCQGFSVVITATLSTGGYRRAGVIRR